MGLKVPPTPPFTRSGNGAELNRLIGTYPEFGDGLQKHLYLEC